MRHIISILMQNEAGALARVVALFSSRGYNIESLSVAPTEDSLVSRLTLVTKGSDEVIDQISLQLLKLVDVVNTADMTRDDHIERELLLMKVKVQAGAEQTLPELIKAAGARVLYGTQGATHPPTFTLFANKRLPRTYVRYLEKRIQAAFGMERTPVKLRLRIRSRS